MRWGVIAAEIALMIAVVSGAVNLSAGANYSCFNYGSQLRCWGWGKHLLGYTSSESVGATPGDMGKLTLIPFTPSLGLVTQVALGNEHICAVFDTGKVACFGDSGDSINGFGQLGIGSSQEVGCSVSSGCLNVNALTGIFSDASVVISVSAGNFHTCALFTTGGVKW
jgi:alpha-tubulin suppressor-like RCC1 family protein